MAWSRGKWQRKLSYLQGGFSAAGRRLELADLLRLDVLRAGATAGEIHEALEREYGRAKRWPDPAQLSMEGFLDAVNATEGAVRCSRVSVNPGTEGRCMRCWRLTANPCCLRPPAAPGATVHESGVLVYTLSKAGQEALERLQGGA